MTARFGCLFNANGQYLV